MMRRKAGAEVFARIFQFRTKIYKPDVASSVLVVERKIRKAPGRARSCSVLRPEA